MLLFMSNRKRPAVRARRSGAGSVIAGAAAMFAVPAHGFVVSGGGLASATADMAPSPIMGWIRSFFGACVWAFMIAAGSLIYSHFVKKWHAQGYPILPVAALAATDNLQPHGGVGAIPLPGSGPRTAQRTARQESPPRQTSFLDEYEG